MVKESAAVDSADDSCCAPAFVVGTGDGGCCVDVMCADSEGDEDGTGIVGGTVGGISEGVA